MRVARGWLEGRTEPSLIPRRQQDPPGAARAAGLGARIGSLSQPRREMGPRRPELREGQVQCLLKADVCSVSAAFLRGASGS